jgi:predicted regulator of Ras-like GTPase activity (Roadblock/LC7/MglB family)
VERLRELQQTMPEVEAAAIVSLDGLIIASALPENLSLIHI